MTEALFEILRAYQRASWFRADSKSCNGKVRLLGYHLVHLVLD